MRPAWSSPTTLSVGLAAARDWLRDQEHVVLVVDHAVMTGAVVTTLTGWLRERGGPALTRYVTAAPTVASLAELTREVEAVTARTGTAPAVLAVGGGATIDLATLVALCHGQPRAWGLVTAPQRSGLVLVPRELMRTLPVAVVPTTMGTGAELSSSACVDTAEGRRLVVGEAMRPDLAVLDAAATQTLPVDLVAEAVLEALFRVTSMMIGDAADRPVEDPLTVALAVALARAGDAVARHRDAGEVPADLRLDVAKLSGLTQGGWLSLGRNRYAATGWYIATELSTGVGCRKVAAVARILPAHWHLVSRGHAAWGDSGRLDRLWSHLRDAADGPLPRDPASGLAELLRHWSIEPTRELSTDEVDTITRRTVRSWGSGLPMLHGLRSADVRELLRIAYTPELVAMPVAQASGTTTWARTLVAPTLMATTP